MLKLYKPEDWTKQDRNEGLRELTGGTKITEEKPPNNQKKVSPPGFEPQAEKNGKKFLPHQDLNLGPNLQKLLLQKLLLQFHHQNQKLKR